MMQNSRASLVSQEKIKHSIGGHSEKSEVVTSTVEYLLLFNRNKKSDW